MPTSSKIVERGGDRGEGQDRRRRGRPAGGARRRHERRRRGRTGRPDRSPTSRPAGAPTQSRAVALVDEDRADRARPAVQVLVGAPGGEVDVPVVERQLDVAGGVGQVPADGRAGGVAGGGQPLDRVGLAGGEVDAGEEDQRDLAGPVGDGRLEILGPDGDSPVRGPTTTRSRSGSRPRAARWVVSAWRSDGKSGPSVRIRRRRPSGRKNEASRRWRFTVRLLSRATSAGSAPTTRAIGSRSAWSRVNHGRPGSNQASTPRLRPGVQLRLDGRPRRARLEPERLAREVDGRGSVGRGREVEPVAHVDVSGSAASRARASASSGEMAPDPCSRLVMGGPPVVGWSQRRVASGDDRPSRPDPCPGPPCGGGAHGRGAGRRLCGVRRQRRTLGRRAICGRHERGHGGTVRSPPASVPSVAPSAATAPTPVPSDGGTAGQVRTDAFGIEQVWVPAGHVHDGHGQGRDREAGGGRRRRTGSPASSRARGRSTR